MNTKSIVGRIGALAVALALLQADDALAQSGLALVRGFVFDSTATAVAGASVTVTNTDTGAQRALTTDAWGRFAAVALPPGVYEIEAGRQGLAARRQEGLRLVAGANVDVRFELREAPIADTITVNDIPAALAPGNAAARDVIDGDTLAALPLFGRNVLDLTATLPAITRRPTGDLAIAGHDALLQRLAVDGFDLTNPAGAGIAGLGGGDAPWALALESVESLRLDVAGYDVESGGGAGVISVQTKAGGNTLRGSALAMAPDNQFGGGIGGPIARNQHFFFASYEGRRETETADDVEDRLAQNALLLRTDHAVSARHHLGARFSYTTFDRRALARGRSSTFDTHAVAGHLNSVLGPSLVHEVRVQVGTRDGSLLLPLYFSGGQIDRLQIANSLTWAGSGHVVKAGIDAGRDDMERVAPSPVDVSRVALFIQDDWRLGDVTLHGGVRNDQERFDPFGTHTDTWSPRGSIAWNPHAGRLVIRGGYGVFYAQTPVFTVLREAPRIRQLTVGGEWEPLRHTVLSATYFHFAGEGIVVEREPRDIAPMLGSPLEVGIVNASSYDAITFGAQRRFAQGYSYRFSYTLARANENDGRGMLDQRHRVAASFVYPTDVLADRYSGWTRHALTDWTFSGVAVLARSGSERGSVDFRAARHFELTGTARLSLLWETVNVTGGGEPIGIITALPEGRVMQVGARLVF
jgi:hypothetical protein